jgi:trk/ktr system potassium uptake protein
MCRFHSRWHKGSEGDVFKSVAANLFSGIHPRAVTPLKLGDWALSEGTRIATLGLVLAWLAIFAVATTHVASQKNLIPLTSATAVAATLNVIGPGLGQVGVSESYEVINPFGRVVLTTCMLLGRLEILTALALLSPAF